jgi:hypothetical protein
MAEALAGSTPAHADLETPVEAAEHAHACANCGANLQGPYCHACGQKGHLHGRLWHLIEEFAEGIAHFDGRLWRTLPLLAFNPGRLSREWRLGRRVRYVAPLHVFLFSVFLFFLVPTVTGEHVIDLRGTAAGEVAEGFIDGEDGPRVSIQGADGVRDRGLEARVQKKLSQPEYLTLKIESLAYKLSFLLIPLSVLILALVAMKRRFTFYDHSVVALYGLGFASLVATAILLSPERVESAVSGPAALALWLHAVGHLKGAYELSWVGAALRSFVLGVLTTVTFAFFVLGVAGLGVLG